VVRYRALGCHTRYCRDGQGNRFRNATFRFSGSVLRIQPPLVITKEELDCALAVIDESLTEVEAGSVPDAVVEKMSGW